MLVMTKLREGLTADQEPRVRTGASGHHAYASEAGGCARKIGYDLMDGRPQWSPTLTQEVAFRIGKDLERAVMTAAELQNPSVLRQVPWILEDGKISGVADGTYIQDEPDGSTVSQGVKQLWDEDITPTPPAGALVVMEVKTMADRYFRQAMKYGPELGHILQASLGAVAMGAEWVHVVYVSKGAKSTEEPGLEWIRKVDRDAVATAVADMLLAVNSADAGVVPDPWAFGELIETPNPKRPPCLWCSWVDRCQAEGVSPGAWQRRMNGQ